MNKVILMGRLTRDPNVRYSPRNNSQEEMAIARYTLAVDRRGAKDGQQSADFISCVAFGRDGEFAEKYLKQGTKVVVTGRIQTGSYTNRDGQKEENDVETEKEMTAIQKTQVYLENYREIERYIKDAISEVSQIDDVSRYNISAEKAFLQSIRECKAETVILFEHMKKALASLKEDAEAAGEGYKYDALEAVYIKGKSYEDIVRETGCGKNSPKKWCRSMTERLSIKLFGAKAIENDKIGVK